MKKLFVIICILLLTGCGTKETMKETITYQELRNLEDYILVDVRTEEEFVSNHIPHAINIPLSTIHADIQLDKNKIIVVYCQSGNRSNQAKELLKPLGYTVYNFGSIHNWEGDM